MKKKCRLPAPAAATPPTEQSSARLKPPASNGGHTAMILMATGCFLWAICWSFLDAYSDDWWQWLVLLAGGLSILCPFLAFLLSLVALIAGDARHRHAVILVSCLLAVPIVYVMLVSIISSLRDSI